MFNTKGEDLLHLDRANVEFEKRPEEAAKWKALGIEEPQPFRSIRLYAPRQDGVTNPVPNVRTRATEDVAAYGWTPEQFIREQLLQFCFTSADDRATQVGFVEQQVRIQLLRRLRRLAGDATGAVVILERVPSDTGFNPDRLAEREPEEAMAGEGMVLRDFGDFVDLFERVANTEDEHLLNEWFGRTQSGTRQAFLRRILRLRRHVGPVVAGDLHSISTEVQKLHVVDISRLHEDAQRFVVGALLDRVWRDKHGAGRTPLRFVVLDELNKYAPAQGFSPLKELLVDIAERGRSLGVLLIGAQQAASAVAQALPRNSSLKVAGRLDASESDAYRFLTPALRERASRFMPGTMVVSQPIVPEPIPVRFPYPPFATNPDEAGRNLDEQREKTEEVGRRMGALAGPEPNL